MWKEKARIWVLSVSGIPSPSTIAPPLASMAADAAQTCDSSSETPARVLMLVVAEGEMEARETEKEAR